MLCGSAQHAAGGRHHQRCGNAFVGDIANHQPQTAIIELKEVIKIAADGAGRLIVCAELPAVELRQFLRQQCLLDDTGDAQFLLGTFAGTSLGLLFAHQLRDPHCWRGLGRQGIEQATVIGRIVLLAEPRAKIEQAQPTHPG